MSESQNLDEKYQRNNFISLFAIFVGLGAFYTAESQFFNSYIIQVLNLSAYMVALMVTFSAIMSTFMYIIFGAFSDSRKGDKKWGRRRPLALGGILAGICMILIPFQSSFFMVFIIDVVLISIFGNMANATRHATIPDVYPIEKRGSINAKLQFGDVFGSAIVFIISLIVLFHYPVVKEEINGSVIDINAPIRHVIIISLAGIMAIIGSLIFFFSIKEPTIDYEPISLRISLKNIFNVEELKKNKSFMKILFIMVIVGAYRYTFLPFLMIYLTHTNVNVLYIALILISFGMGTCVGFMKFGPWLDKNPRKKITLISVTICGIGLSLVSIFGNLENLTITGLVILCIATFIATFGATGLDISQLTWSQDLLPKEERGKFVGIRNLVFTVGQIPGAFIGAWIFETYGVQWVFLGAGIIVLVLGQFYWLGDETYFIEKPYKQKLQF